MSRAWFLIAAVATLTSACVVVHPQQREYRSRRTMIDDEDIGEQRFKHHAEGAREGAEGGTSMPGGGCGCN